MNNLLAVNLPVVVDAVAVIFVVAFAVYGFSKGFIRQFVSAFGTIFSLLFAVLLCSSVTVFLQSRFGLVETVSHGIGGWLSKLIGADASQITLGELMNEQGRELLTQKGMPVWMINLVMVFVADETSLPMSTTVYEVLCPTFAYYVVLILSAVALFLVFKILFYILSKFVIKLHTIKLIAVCDKTLGFVLGIFSGIIYLELIIMLLGIIPIQFVQEVYSAVQSSTFASFIARINLYNVVLNTISTPNVVKFVKDLII